MEKYLKNYKNFDINFFNFFPKYIYIIEKKFLDYIQIFNLSLNSFYFLFYFLKHTFLLNFNFLIDFFCLDLLGFSLFFRYKLFYILRSLKNNYDIIFSYYLKDFKQKKYLEKFWYNSFSFYNGLSIISLYNSSFWLEREIWDMFGIYFINNKNLTRILTDYGYKWNPLKKDFPLFGITELKYFYSLKKIRYKPLKLIQEFKKFFFNKNILNIFLKKNKIITYLF